MNSVFNEIVLLRKGEIPADILMEKNPYTVSVKESDGSTTCYFFSIPIRHSTGKIIRNVWIKTSDRWSHKSIGGNIIVYGNELQMTQSQEKCLFIFPDRYESDTPEMIVRNYSSVMPTPNGVVISTRLGQGREYQLTLSDYSLGMRVVQNDKSFTLFTKHGKPFVTVSGVCSSDRNKNSMGAVSVFGQKISSKEYKLIIKPSIPAGNEMYIDIAFHSQSLLQDFTIESRHPAQCNLYGSGASLGNTIPYGEQWLYTKLQANLLPEYSFRKIKTAIWHIPCHCTPDALLDFFPILGTSVKNETTWKNRPQNYANSLPSEYQNPYIHFNITNEIRKEKERYLKDDFRGILKVHHPGRHLVSISTADSNYAPQILEVNFEPCKKGI